MNETKSTDNQMIRTSSLGDYLTDETFNIFIILLVSTIGLISVAMNIFIFFFYRKKNSNIQHVIYRYNAVLDCALGLCALLHGGILASSINYTICPLRILVPLEAFLFAVASRLESVYNLILCVTRAINVLFPVYQVRSKIIKWVLLTYPLIWVALALNEVIAVESSAAMGGDYMLSVVFLVINPQTGDEFFWTVHPEMNPKLTYFVLLGIPFVLPGIITLICAVLICICLLRKTSNNSSQIQRRRITVTVLLLTLSSLLFSCLYFVTELALLLYRPDIRFFKYEYYLVYFAGNVSVFLNSVIKPSILVSRGTGIREYLRSTLSLSKSK